MSISRSLYIGISGLQAHGDAIGVVGDNIANTSTIGFKRARASFSDMLGGAMAGQRLGGGVMMDGTQTMWEQGAIQNTGNPLDVAIRGGGMFVVNGTKDGQTSNFYTRDGRFELDNSGFVVNQGGLRLQGYTINSAGVQSTTSGDLPLGARQSPPLATSTASLTLNLDAQATVGPAWDPTNPTGTSNYATSMTVYDSLGTAHQAQVYFRANGAGAWEWHAMVDGGELTGGTPGTPTQIANGTLTFNTSGALQAQTTASSSASFLNAVPNQAVAFSFGDDIASGGTGFAGSTSFTGSSTVTALDVDGHGFGNLVDLDIGEDGTISGIFDNGERFALARVALANFASEDGLVRAGDSLMMESTESGAALVDVAGSGARGSLVSGALEASNVDLGQELVTLIAYQRAFQGNAKTITTADELMSEVNNLKR